MTDKRILCVWLPYWATTRLAHARHKSASAQPDEALATAHAVRGMRRLASICPRAEAAGLHADQPLTQARAILPALVVAEAEPDEDATALAALAQWSTRYTPLAAPCPPDALWLDIAGCAHLFGGEAALAADLAARLAKWGLISSWAIAGTTGAAWALAHHAPAACQGLAIVAAGAEAAALAPLPLAGLRLPGDTLAGLRRLGLKTVAALARLPRADLNARFGPEPSRRLDQALGRMAETIAWPRPATDWEETQRFAEPISSTEDCQRALALLGHRLCAALHAKRLGGRHFLARFQRVDGLVETLAVATALPVCDPAYLLQLLADKLDSLDPGFGIERVSLHAAQVESWSASQVDLLGAGGQDGRGKLAQLIDALANRLRPGWLWRLAPNDSHLPERAANPVAALAGPRPAAWQHDAASPRPIRLLAQPEPIAVTAPLPDDPPLQFRWRGALHRVRAATGPERISPEWWTDSQTPERDYYQVEDDKGARFWLFRNDTAWFMHGLFA